VGNGKSKEPLLTHESLWRSLAWIGGTRWTIQLFTWASTLVVASLLAPADYGIVGLASLYIGVVTMIADFGLGSAVVTLRSLTAHQIAQLNVLSGLTGIVLLGMSFVLAWPIARFFETPQLPPVIILMTLSIAISGWQSIPDALLQNQLRFRALAFRDAARGLGAALCTIVLALLGFGYWALAGGVVAGSVCGLLVTLALQRAPFARPRFGELQQPLSYSGYSLSSRLAWYGYSNADFLVAGKVLSTASLGAYALAWSLANVTVEKVTTLVGRVTPSFFSAAQKDRALLTAYFEMLTRAIALVSFPVSVGIALVASDLVPAALGPQWIPAVAPLVPLSLYAGFRSLTQLLSTIMRVTGDQRFGALNAFAGLLMMPVIFYVGSFWGPVGIAYGWVVGFPVLVIPLYRRVFWRLAIGWRSYLAWVSPPLVSTLIMAVVVMTLKVVLRPIVSVWLGLSILILSGALTYLGALLILFRPSLETLRRSMRGGVVQTDPVSAV
jgi:teichuronic acid exporter